jgi:hypothetical protein
VGSKAKRAAPAPLPKIVKRQVPKAPPRPSRAKATKTPAKEKPPIGLPDPLEAALEAQRLAQEGNVKLSRSVDALRSACELVVSAEQDYTTGRPVSVQDLKGIVVAALDEYSRISGQSWKRHKLVGNWAGSTGNKPVHESEMK